MTEMMNIYSEKKSETIASSNGIKLMMTNIIDKTAAFFFKLCSSHLMKTSRDSYEIILPTDKHPFFLQQFFAGICAVTFLYRFTAVQIVQRSISTIGEWFERESSI